MFLIIFVFLGESFLPPERKNIVNKNVPTYRPYLEGPSASQPGFLFFIFIALYCELNSAVALEVTTTQGSTL